MSKINSNTISVDSFDQGTFYTILSCMNEVNEYSSVYCFVVAEEKGDKSFLKFKVTSKCLVQITVIEIFRVNSGTFSAVYKNNSVLLSLCLRNFLKSVDRIRIFHRNKSSIFYKLSTTGLQTIFTVHINNKL